MVVERGRVLAQPWSVEDARARLEPFDRRALVSMGRAHLEARGRLPTLATDADVLELLARELVDGALRLVDVTESPRPLDAEAVVDLAELAEPAVPIERPPPAGVSEPRETFIEVRLEDERGTPVEADYVLSIDGAPHAGHFGPEHRVDPISRDAIATLRLERVAVPHEPRPKVERPIDPDGPVVPEPSHPYPDVPPDPAHPQTYVDTRLQLEDDAGEAIAKVRCIVQVDGADMPIEYAGEPIVLPDGVGGRLRLEALRLPAPRA